ncbi:hypothetical protein KEM54_005382 [Ascosphaera aggregata]|nr:hypothetical protein KEM54_005382 [Ascosphaera aggregata]
MANVSTSGFNMAQTNGGSFIQRDDLMPSSQPAFFSSLLERGKKRQNVLNAEPGPAEIPSLQLGIGGLRSLAQGISRHDRDELQGRIVEKKGLSSLAASGIPPSVVRSKLAALDSQAPARATSRNNESFEPDTQRFLRQIQQRGKDAIAADSFARVRNEFNSFLEDKIALSWEEQRDKMFEKLGLGSTNSDKPANDFSKTKSGFGATSTLGPRSSVFGRSGLKKSVIGTPATDIMGMHGFGETAVRRADAYPLNIRALRQKMGRFASVVRTLNGARMQEKSLPLLHEFRDIEQSSNDTPRQLVDAYDALIKIVGERPSSDDIGPHHLDLARDYLNDVGGSEASINVRQRIVDGSRAFLEERFRAQLNEIVASDPREAQIGGIPSVTNKVRAYVRLRNARKDLAPDNTELQMVGQDHCWVLIFYLLRAGFVDEAADYVTTNVGFRSMDQKFAAYMTAYARGRQLPRDLQQKLHTEYQQRVRNAPEIDPYRMACYKIIGRCDPSHRRFDGITQGIEDWIWLQFVFAREDHRYEEPAGDSFYLQDIRKDFLDIGQRLFSDNDENYAVYFLMQVLGGMFEQAVSYLKRFEPVSAVHFAIGLEYYGLLRVANFYTSNDILSFTTSDLPQINFASIVTQYTRDFRTGDAEAAVDYFSLLCLNVDTLGEVGASQVAVCHEALREFILESREFTKLLGDIRPDGTRIKGAIEQRSRLFGVDDNAEFFKTVTLQAAAVASDKGLVADAARLYHLAEEYDIVMSLLSQSLSDVIASDAPISAPVVSQDSKDAEFPSAEPVILASNLMKLYDGNAMYYTKIRQENLRSCILLLNAIDAKRMMDKSLWSKALDMINDLQILPLTAEGSVSYIKGAVQAFSSLPLVVSRIVGQLIMWSIHCIAKERERLQQNLFENDMRHTLFDQYLAMAKDLMTFAGMCLSYAACPPPPTPNLGPTGVDFAIGGAMKWPKHGRGACLHDKAPRFHASDVINAVRNSKPASSHALHEYPQEPASFALESPVINTTANMTSLLDLPAEVLGLILAETTPAAFIQIAYSCSALLMLAANDCLLLLYHLRQIPEVIDSEWDNLDASRLFRLLCRKALLSLVPGFQVEEREFTFDNGMFNAHISKFFERNGILSLALASKTSDRVTVYDLGADQPRLLRMLDAPCDARTSVHALLWTTGSALGDLSHHPLGKDYRQLSMAVAGDGTIAISWQNLDDVFGTYVARYTDANSHNDGRQRLGNPVLGPFTELRFNDNDTQLLYWRAASAIYEYYQQLDSSGIYPGRRLSKNRSAATYLEMELVRSATKIATPFFCTHSQRQTNFMVANCHWKYLALGTIERHQTYGTTAVLVRAEARCRSQNCNHTPNLDRGRRLPHWQCVAELEGYNDVAHLGPVKSISYAHSGRRLAFASGSAICVWSLIPTTLIEGPQEQGRDYRCHNLRSGIVCLKPDVIELSQEIMQHKFSGDDKLLVLTAKGIMCLKLGSLVKSHARTPLELPCEYGNLVDKSTIANIGY